LKHLLPIFLVLFISVPWCAFAQDLPAPSTQLLVHEGHPGYWFPEAAATKMLADLEELPPLRQKTDLLELKIKKMEEFELLLKRDLEVTEEISGKWKTAFDEQITINATYEKKLNAWYRSPVLWTGVGMLLGGGFAVLLNFGLSEARQ
jgi:hypothetical protein